MSTGPHIQLTVDGKTWMNGRLGEWSDRPPEFVAEHLKPNSRPPSWINAVMAAIAEAAITNIGVTMTVSTAANGWTVQLSNHGYVEAES